MTAPPRDLTEPAPAREAPAVIELPAPRPRRKGGVRRKAVNPRTATIRLRATPAQKASIRADAKAAGMTLTRYVFSHLPGSAEPPGIAPAPADPAILVRILAELGKFGSNHNQLARRFNTTGEEPDGDEWRRVATALWDMRDAVLKALGRGD
jgi:hypothetical protein